MIQVSHVYHDYEGKGKFAVSDISFSVEGGNIFGFLGPSGAGKSTIQNIMTGLLPIQKGEVLYNGKSVRGLRTAFFNQIGVFRIGGATPSGSSGGARLSRRRALQERKSGRKSALVKGVG